MVTLDFSKDNFSQIDFPNIFDKDVINFNYEVKAPAGIQNNLTLSLWGINDSGQEMLWIMRQFIEIPRNQSFQVKFDNLNNYQSFSLRAERYNNDALDIGKITLTVPEPSVYSMMLLAVVLGFLITETRKKI